MKKLLFAMMVVSGAALPLCAAELTHRWSFNGDYSDSAGGVDAAKTAARADGGIDF